MNEHQTTKNEETQSTSEQPNVKNDTNDKTNQQNSLHNENNQKTYIKTLTMKKVQHLKTKHKNSQQEIKVINKVIQKKM